ncbi:MAG: flagellar hook-associated protein FlgL [Planctomycetaceae bacterium]
MTISTFYTGRTTSALHAQQLIANVQNSQNALSRLQQQISTGSRLLSPSDDPVAAMTALILQNELDRRSSYQSNITTNQGFLAASDQALGTVSDALNQAKSIAQNGLNSSLSDTDRAALADQVASLIQTVTNAGNTMYNGRYVFGGSYGDSAPFSSSGDFIRYNGDNQSLLTFADFNSLVANNIDGQSAFAGLTKPNATQDLNPTLSLAAPLASLHGGSGVTSGAIDITVVDGSTTITKSVDLSNADTLQDVKDRIQNAFASSSVTVSVGINSSNSGLSITPSSGTISIQNATGSKAASDLGIASTAAASINGGDLDPRLSIFTPLSTLNNGAGIGSTAGTGLKIVNGTRTSTVDLNGAVTVQDVLNRIRAADPDVVADISSDGRGISVSSRLSGADFSIGENGGTNATALGIRTFTGSTPLSQLNYGSGIALDQNQGTALSIARRDGTTATVDLTGVATVQDVLDKINAVDPGHLTASLNSVGNGISLTDDSGTGTLTVADSELSRRLGIAGSDSSGATGVLVGKDVNPQQPSGALNILATLQTALRTNDTQTLNRLLPQIDSEVSRVNSARAAVGSKEQLLTTLQNGLGDANLQSKDQLSKVKDVDMTTAITQLLQMQQSLQATLQVAAQINQMSILQYL